MGEPEDRENSANVPSELLLPVEKSRAGGGFEQREGSQELFVLSSLSVSQYNRFLTTIIFQ